MARRTTLLALLFVVATGRAAPVDFNRDVRPILADNCFLCHGPGDTTRKADLRLDTRDGLRAATKELLARVTATDDKRRMPPAKSGKKLSDVQIATLKAWVDQGANWTGHWAFTKPIRPAIPATKHPTSNSIDAFVRAKLEAEGLAPSAPADKVTLIRRVTLDLTGLPPSPSEVDAFLADDSPAAYERVVERLLASSRFGERMAWRWLEAGRYADTNGYQTDAGRDMWRWRDWVIEAYNRNLPFDRFTIEQIAGDLLPNPTLDQRIATGFHRNHRGNSEGGIVPEEYAVEYVADRVETTGTVWLGLTFTCNRCHDHKYDPFPQADFYRMFAYFNNVPEQGRAAKYGNSPPTIKAPTRDQQAKLAELDSRIGSAQLHASEAYRDIVRAQADWEKTADPKAFPDWAPGRGQVAWFHLDGPGRLKFPDGAATFGPGTIGKAIEFNGKMFADLGDTADFGFDDRFTLACWINPKKPDGAIVSRTVEDPHGEGYSIHLVNGRVQVHLTKRWLDDALRLETETTVPLDVWSHIAVTYDATRLVSGVKVYINGLECKTKAMFDELNQSFANKEPFRIGSGSA